MEQTFIKAVKQIKQNTRNIAKTTNVASNLVFLEDIRDTDAVLSTTKLLYDNRTDTLFQNEKDQWRNVNRQHVVINTIGSFALKPYGQFDFIITRLDIEPYLDTVEILLQDKDTAMTVLYEYGLDLSDFVFDKEGVKITILGASTQSNTISAHYVEVL